MLEVVLIDVELEGLIELDKDVDGGAVTIELLRDVLLDVDGVVLGSGGHQGTIPGKGHVVGGQVGATGPYITPVLLHTGTGIG